MAAERSGGSSGPRGHEGGIPEVTADARPSEEPFQAETRDQKDPRGMRHLPYF